MTSISRTHRTSTRRPNGFSLVEILIVITVLGILTAIVIPHYSVARDEAKATNAASQLQTMNTVIQRYKLEHQDNYPTLAQFQGDWTPLMERTNVDGTVSTTGGFGPYLKDRPVNPFTNSFTVVALGTGTASDGWEYDEQTGRFWAVGFDEATGDFTAP